MSGMTIPVPKHAHLKECGENVGHIVEMHFASEDEAHKVIKSVRDAHTADKPFQAWHYPSAD